MQIVRINRRGNSLGVNVPRPYLRQLCWGVGQYLMLEIDDGSLRFRPVHGHGLSQTSSAKQTMESENATQQA
jgi:antitoxin component of MazEF toxin-antitoxin module